MSDAFNFVDDFVKDQWAVANTVCDEFNGNFKGTSGRQLTDKEKFAIAWISGVKVKPKPSDSLDYVITFITERCDVAWDGEKFLVGTLAEVKP